MARGRDYMAIGLLVAHHPRAGYTMTLALFLGARFFQGPSPYRGELRPPKICRGLGPLVMRHSLICL